MANNGTKTSHEIRAFLTTLRKFHRHATLVEHLRFDGEFQSQVAAIVEPGEYRHLRRTEATERYLFLSPMPQTAAQIDNALAIGGVKTKARDTLKAQYACLDYGKKTGRFKKYGTGDYWTVAR